MKIQRVLAATLAAPLLMTHWNASAKTKAPAAPAGPNVIIILADDLGYGDMEPYGAKRVKTPAVNRLASRGTTFTNTHAVAATSTPSRYSLLTGEYAWRRPDTGIAAGNAGMIIRPSQLRIPHGGNRQVASGAGRPYGRTGLERTAAVLSCRHRFRLPLYNGCHCRPCAVRVY